MKREMYSLTTLPVEDVINIYSPVELEILLWVEPDILETDILLDNIEYYCVEEELYEYAAIARDEIKRRKSKSKRIGRV